MEINDTMTSKDVDAVENNLDELSAKLDNMLNGTKDMTDELERMKEIIDKQNKVIEKQMTDIRELKDINLQLANHDPNQKTLTTEDMLANAFGNFSR